MLNPNLPGLNAPDTLALAEKVAATSDAALPYCWTKCVTHFGDDALPYHPGEKTCFDRCMTKIWLGYDIAKDARLVTEAVARESEGMKWKWMRDLDDFYKNSTPEFQ